MIKLKQIDYKKVIQKFIWMNLTSKYGYGAFTLRTMTLNNCPKQFDTIQSLSQENLRINKHND